MHRPPLLATIVIGHMVVVAVVLVALTLRPAEVPTYEPTPPRPRDAGTALVGPVLYTVDATDTHRRRHFSFRVGATVDATPATGWDLAFRRYEIIANGGRGFLGRGGARDLGAVDFDSVATVPADGYTENEGRNDPRNTALTRWYAYGFFSHLLEPKGHVWAIRTADGRYAKMEIVSYYCPGSRPGCVTLRYVFQGDGSTAVAPRR
ncbi:MAG: HmuY family protein [Candidatus Rokubacteria bacterium]|nr:HmuY family protein [Candidatus Rokubacteria bacterium]